MCQCQSLCFMGHGCHGFFPLRMLRLEAKKLCSDYGVANVPRSRTRSRTRGVAGVGVNAGNWIEETLPNWPKCSDW
jgi:hypothetical protein